MRKKGFTLIEILVVISIIGILATLILAKLGGVEKAGRDTRRRSDLNQYRTALENFALKNNSLYPSLTVAGEDASGSLCTALGTSNIAVCPQDPRQDGSTYFYRYISNGTGGSSVSATNYMLWTTMENYSSATYLYVCSSGKLNITSPNAPTTALCW
jgi:prepilin-type N-terminal cleavage/methylation domain-containing protein